MAKGIITSREQNAQFDAAVKDIMKQRKAAQQLQMAARQHKQLSKNGGPSNAQQVAQLKENRAKLQALVRTPEFAQLAADRGASSSDIASMARSRRSSESLNTSQHKQQRRPSRKLNHPHLSQSTNTAGGNNNSVVNSLGLQQLRKDHPRRGSGSGSFNNRRATVDLGVASNGPRQFSSSLPNYDSRRSSDGDTTPPSRSNSGGSNRPARRFTLDRSQSFAAVSNNLLSTRSKSQDSLPQDAAPMKKNMSSNELSDMMMMNTADKSLSLTPPREIPLTKGTYKPKSKTKQFNGKSPGGNNLKVKDGSPHGEGKEIVLDGSEGSNNRASLKNQITTGSASPQHTRNVSTTSSQSIGELDLGQDIKEGENNSPTNALSLSNTLGDIKLEDLVPTRRKSQDMSEQEGDEIVDQWRNKDLKLEPGGDFTLASTVEGDKPKEEDRKKTLTPSSSGRSYHTAHSREASSSPILEQGGDRRILLKSQAKSQSGDTGKTAGTSASSLISSGDSFKANLADSTHGKSGNSSPNFEVIKEDDGKDAGGDSRKKIGMQRSTSEADIGDSGRQEREFGDSFEHDMPGFSSYKKRRSSRIKKIRKSIAMTLMGGSSNSSNRSPLDGDQSEGGISSHQGSAISAEQQERLTRHLQRKSSAKSFNSAHTSTSAVTTSSNKSQNSSSRWSRFRKGKSHSMRNMQSSGVDSNRGSNSRHILLTNRRMSNRSNSSRSNISNISNDDSQSTSFSGRFIDFYDNNDHAQAVSILITAKSASNRSLMTPLPTVDEPEGEQKHDEDYHSIRDVMKPEKSAYHLYMEDSGHSDDTMTYYRHPSHEHTLVHMCPTQLFPDSPGWQCDECCQETFDLNVWAYISTEQNYCLCEECFSKSGSALEN